MLPLSFTNYVTSTIHFWAWISRRSREAGQTKFVRRVYWQRLSWLCNLTLCLREFQEISDIQFSRYGDHHTRSPVTSKAETDMEWWGHNHVIFENIKYLLIKKCTSHKANNIIKETTLLWHRFFLVNFAKIF